MMLEFCSGSIVPDAALSRCTPVERAGGLLRYRICKHYPSRRDSRARMLARRLVAHDQQQGATVTTSAAQDTADGAALPLHPVYAALTDRGQRRKNNQDYVYAGPIRAAAGQPERHLLIVADGVGG